MGLLDFAVPLVVSGHYTGAVLAGQVVLNDETEKSRLEKIVDSNGISLDAGLEAKLKGLYGLLPVFSMDRVQVIAKMTFQVTNYILEEALAKINLNEALEERLSPAGAGISAASATSPAHSFYPPGYNSLILKPALEYIRGNFEKRISLDDMASLCNISSSYFSKLFNKITGDNFANYINQVRIDRACELLAGTDAPITVIAMDLGFEDNSYFDKVFKRLTGVTPSFYKSAKRG
jgi:AraC-like DNA-binding protein